jgi:hypothetical protein
MEDSLKTSMPLTEVIRAWRDERDWQDEITINDEELSSALQLSYNEEGQVYKVYVEAEEKTQWLKVFIYGPIGIPSSRYVEACQLVNHINRFDGFGRLCAVKDGKFQFRAVFDLEGGQAVPEMITNMISHGLFRFTDWANEMAQVVFSGKTTEQILKDIEAAAENQSVTEVDRDDGTLEKS